MGPVKLPFAESDLLPLIKRYSSATVVTMLREIARCKSARLDWVVLCKGTATGIKNPKEYQAVWRSIAYRAELADSFDANDAPLEDDSDVEVDLDPVPSVSPAVVDSISAFVKADLRQHGVEEARVEQGAVQTGMGLQGGGLATSRLQQCAATPGESAAVLSCSTSKAVYAGAVNQSDRKRRRLWTPEEDLALISAVDKCGEGNWTTVLKNHYDFDRSASQLSQRWALIRKRREIQEKAGYAGSGVSPLASGYKDVRPEGLKSGTLAAEAGSQLGASKDVGLKSGTSAAGAGSEPKDVGRLGDKIMSTGSVPMSVKQPLFSTSSVPVSKRLPVGSSATGTETAPGSVAEMQRVRHLPASRVSPSWAGVPGLRPQAHCQAPIRAGASGHKGGGGGGVSPEAHAAAGVRRPAGQVFNTSSQSVTSTTAIDSKYAASRNVGGGVARGASKGSHGPDPMIQAAAMAAGARIAPASAAASLLMAAQSGNVVHIGSGGLPRSKLGLTSQGGSGNAGGSPGIVHYIRTGSGGASLATNGPGLQRTSSHHAQKTQSNQPNRGVSSNAGSYPAGNSSPLAAPTVPPQASRNNAQAPVQSSKHASSSKRGSSPQQKTPPSTFTPTLASTPASTPAPTSIATSALSPAPTSGPTPTPTSGPTPALTSVARPAVASGATPAPKSISPPAPTSGPTPSGPTPAPTSGPTLAPKSTSSPAPTATATPICGFNTAEPIVDLAEEGTTP